MRIKYKLDNAIIDGRKMDALAAFLWPGMSLKNVISKLFEEIPMLYMDKHASTELLDDLRLFFRVLGDWLLRDASWTTSAQLLYTSG